MRVRRSFERSEGEKTAKLIVIASEGKETERIYFESIKEYFCSTNVLIKVLKRENTDSSPEYVLEQLRNFEKDFTLNEDDELWMVIDRDRWKIKTLKQVASQCKQNKYLRFALSNPCFELWLLLHLEDIANMTPDELKALKENKRVSRRGDTWLKTRVRRLLGSYCESKYDAVRLMPHVNTARDRAEQLDVKKTERWPSGIGSHVYRLIDSINNADNG